MITIINSLSLSFPQWSTAGAEITVLLLRTQPRTMKGFLAQARTRSEFSFAYFACYQEVCLSKVYIQSNMLKSNMLGENIFLQVFHYLTYSLTDRSNFAEHTSTEFFFVFLICPPFLWKPTNPNIDDIFLSPLSVAHIALM